MNIRPILVGAGVLALGGYALYDYYSPESKLARELKEIEQLEPDVKPPECFPKGLNSKLFAVAIQRDRRPKAELVNEVTRRSAIKHDCIRGNDPKTVQRVVKALGAGGVPVYAEVLEKCPVVKDEYPVMGCFALDALYAEGSKASVAAMEKELTNKDKARKNVYLGALFRLMNTQGWKTNGQLAQMLQAAWVSPLMPDLVASLPALGLDGTLRRQRQNVGLAHLKTGSLNEVSGVAGYVHGQQGRRWIVVAIANHPRRASAIRPAVQALIEWTARQQ